ncbi:MAG: S41 family peptidase [Myxococcota bacterium]
MMIASNNGAGGNFAFPDVCNTPAGPAVVPIPYPNMALNAMAFPFSPTVRYSFMNALNLGSMIPMTSGDEGGVAHPMFKQAARYSMGNPKIFISMLPGIMLGCPTSGNNMNAPLGAAIIPSVTNVFLSDASPGALPEAEERVTWRRIDRDAGVVQLPRLTAHSATEFDAALAALDVGRIVLDLRGNPGGPLDAARRVLERLLPQGAHLYTVHETDGDWDEVRARHGGRAEPRLAVLVDRRTASAAEVIVAALRHHRRAAVVGETTFGKGTVQVGRSTPQGWQYGQVAECEAPDGLRWNGVGITPDIACAPQAAEEAAGRIW